MSDVFISYARSTAPEALAQDRNNGSAISFGVTALAALGEGERAKEWIGRALLIDPDNWLMRYNLACALTNLLNAAETTLELLGPVFANISAALLRAAKTDPDFDPLCGAPRFVAMPADAEARLAAKDGAGGAPA